MDIRSKLPTRLQPVFDIVDATIVSWGEDKAPMRAAAMSYYFLVTLAPLTMFFVWVLSRLVSGLDPADLVDRAGPITPTADVGSQIVNIAQRYGEQVGTSGPVIAIGIALLGATVLLSQFTAALDEVWDSRPDTPGWLYALQTRLFALVGLLVILVAVLAAGVLIALLGLGGEIVRESFGVGLQLPGWLSGLTSLSAWVSLALGTVLLAVAFTWLPRRKIRWRDTLFPSFLTAGAYLVGQQVLSANLRGNAVVTAFGAVGSVVALVVWIYYTMQVVLFGAELTRVLVERAEERRARAQ